MPPAPKGGGIKNRTLHSRDTGLIPVYPGYFLRVVLTILGDFRSMTPPDGAKGSFLAETQSKTIR